MIKAVIQHFPKGGIGRSLMMSGGILLLPLLILFAQTLWAKKSEIDTLALHMQMLEWVTPIYRMLDHTSQYRGLREISSHYPGHYDLAEEHLTTLEQMVDEELEQMHNLQSQLPTKLPINREINDTLHRIEELWLEQQGEAFSFTRMNDLISHLNSLLERLLPERVGHQRLLLRDIPRLREVIAQLRGTGSGFLARAAANQQPGSTLYYDQNDPLLKRIERTLWDSENQFIQLRDSLNEEQHILTERTLSIMMELVGEIQEVRDLVEWELIDAATVSLSPELFFEEASEPVYLLHLLAMDILANTKSTIQQEIREKQLDSLWTIILVLFSLIFALAVVFYYMQRLFMGVRNAVQQLQAIGTGDFEQNIETPYNQGEISTLLDSIKDTQHQLKESYNALTAERHFSDNLTTSMDDGVYALNQSGDLMFINQAAEQILGWSADEIIGKNFHELAHAIRPDGSHIPQTECPTIESITNGTSYHSEQEWFQHRDGHFIPVELSAAPLSSGGVVSGSVAVFRDISKRLEIDQQLREALNDAQQASHSKDEFLASMSHELRTPLTSIIGNCEMLAELNNSDEAKSFIDSIESSGRQQLALVNDILDLSKIESGKFTIDEKPFNPDTLVKTIAQIFTAPIQNTPLQFEIKVDQPFTHHLIGDPQRITQILINLIGNAVKFTKQGKVTLSVSFTGQQIAYCIEDTGIGMPEEVLKRLFQRFEQGDSSISRRFGGSGLGLYISHHLAQLMDGTIEVESREHHGSTFTLKLPYRIGEQLQQKSQREVEADKSRAKAPAKLFEGTILLAEDTPELQLLIQKILQAMGLTVATANNGAEALEQSRAGNFDLILMDMQMPEMDGIEATRQIRTFDTSTPIVALTANVLQKHRDAFDQVGGNHFLSKPIDRQELTRLLQRYLYKR